MSETPILVLGGTGKTGRRVAHQLAGRGRSAKIASRSGGQRFDWQDEGTWAPAAGPPAHHGVLDRGVEHWASTSLRAEAAMIRPVVAHTEYHRDADRVR